MADIELGNSDKFALARQILPDVASPIVILGIFLLAFCGKRLSRAEQIYLFLLTTLAIATHLSHIPIAIGLVVGSVVAKIAFLRERISLSHRATLIGQWRLLRLH